MKQLILILIGFLSTSISAQYWQQEVDYTMSVQFGHRNGHIYGNSKIDLYQQFT